MAMLSELHTALISRWMAWNLFLAVVPLVLSLVLFRVELRRSPLWWLGFAVFVAFLPNAPYVLTDFIHLENDLARINSDLLDTLVVIPRYAVFMLLGFGAYVLSLMHLGTYLKQVGRPQWILPMELGLHILSAAGVYLGRVERFNSWDFVTQLDVLVRSMAENLTHGYAWAFTVISFGAIAWLHGLTKYVLQALALQYRLRLRHRRQAYLPHA
jgi:uncharacterized membrane protein